MKVYNFLLLGGDFVNKGAEAMILSSQELLAKHFPESKIVVATYERKNIGSVKYPGLTIVGNKWLKGKAILYAKMLVPLIGKKMIKGNLINRYKKADVVINIGGFSLSDKLSLQGTLVYCIEILLCKKLGKPFVVLQQDMGPFDKRFRRLLIRKCLSQAIMIVVRSEESKKNLERIGIRGVYVLPDLAFNLPTVEADSKMLPPGPFVCIVPNMRVYERNGDYINKLIEITNHITKNLKANVLLLPHEYKETGRDDRFIIDKVTNGIENKNKVYAITEEYSSSELKMMIGKAEMLISSRFHGAIAGITMCVPTITIGWAHKYKELLKSVGLTKFAMDCDNIDVKKIDEMWKCRRNIKKSLEPVILKRKKQSEKSVLLLKEKLSEGIGKIEGTYVGFSTDKTIYENGQSGGLVSALLIFALKNKLIDGAIVTRWNEKDPLIPEMFIARTTYEVMGAAKSKYYPLQIDDILKEIKEVNGKFAFVGVPCQIHKLKRLEQEDRQLKNKIVFHFGLFCDRVLKPEFIQYILSIAKVKREDVSGFSYRSKEWRGYPGDIEIKLKDGTTKNIPKEYRMKVKSLFTPEQCFVCKDKLNKLSDISFGDAWLPGHKKKGSDYCCK